MYERVITAALAETQGKFRLAEALALDIPPRHPGPQGADEPVNVYLAQAQEAIALAGGETRSINTLDEYRRTALWVSGGTSRNFQWVKGASFTAHNEARKAGLSVEQFTAAPSKRLRDFRPTSPEQPSNVISTWTPEQQAEAAKTLMSDPGVADAAMRDLHARNRAAEAISQHHDRVREHVERGPHAQAREARQTRIEVMQVGLDLIKVRQSIGRLAALGRIEPIEMEMLADDAKLTLPAVQWVADLSPDQADIGDQAAAFLRSL